MLTLNHIDDEGEVEERPEHAVELVEAIEDAPESFEPAKDLLDFVAASVEISAI